MSNDIRKILETAAATMTAVMPEEVAPLTQRKHKRAQAANTSTQEKRTISCNRARVGLLPKTTHILKT